MKNKLILMTGILWLLSAQSKVFANNAKELGIFAPKIKKVMKDKKTGKRTFYYVKSQECAVYYLETDSEEIDILLWAHFRNKHYRPHPISKIVTNEGRIDVKASFPGIQTDNFVIDFIPQWSSRSTFPGLENDELYIGTKVQKLNSKGNLKELEVNGVGESPRKRRRKGTSEVIAYTNLMNKFPSCELLKVLPPVNRFK